MSTKNTTDLGKLEWFNIALTNANSEQEISEALAAVGISEEALAEGKALHLKANEAYMNSTTARKRQEETREDYILKLGELEKEYSMDRKKAKIAFLSDSLAMKKLELSKRNPKDRLKQFEKSRSFYTLLSEDAELLEALSKFGFSSEKVTARLESISEIEKARASYMFEKAVSQNATIEKNNAIDKLSKWMTRFFSISREAFKDNPQLMEAFGLVIKN